MSAAVKTLRVTDSGSFPRGMTTRETFALAGISEVEAIYLTGGSSRIPLVQRRLRAVGAVATLDDPKTVVARGALIVAIGHRGAGRRPLASPTVPPPPLPIADIPRLLPPERDDEEFRRRLLERIARHMHGELRRRLAAAERELTAIRAGEKAPVVAHPDRAVVHRGETRAKEAEKRAGQAAAAVKSKDITIGWLTAALATVAVGLLASLVALGDSVERDAKQSLVQRYGTISRLDCGGATGLEAVFHASVDCQYQHNGKTWKSRFTYLNGRYGLG
ncbi:MAG: hypothetical protein HOQ24_00205 [Mycobacteriaceae bacterium]|nr:hypothetical protein [Mycobacteriaceae bacterium]